MAESEREQAQRRRAESRRRRREQSDGEPARAAESEQDDSKPEESLEAVKHAAKVAAAAAAVGAAVGAARAITGDSSADAKPEPAEPAEEPQPPEPTAEHDQPQESDEGREEQPAQERPEPTGRHEQPQNRAEEREEERPTKERDDGPRPAGASPDEARRVVASAREQLAALGKDADSVSGLDRNGDGWLVTLEVVELSRIPESTDVLASYELELDRDRKLVRYQRGRRYYRSQADERALT